MAVGLEVWILVLEGTDTSVVVALLMANVVVSDAAADAVAKTAIRLAINASCACRRSSIASRNSRTSCGKFEKPCSIDVTISVKSAASVSAAGLGSLCSGIVVA